ncbi:hypothetical protein AAFF_G00247070, partial [Aldrovandia affinis]
MEAMEIMAEHEEGDSLPFLHATPCTWLRYGDAPNRVGKFATDSYSQHLAVDEGMVLCSTFGNDRDPPTFCSISTYGSLARMEVGTPLPVDDMFSDSSGSYHTALCSNQSSDYSETFQDCKLSPSPEPPESALSPIKIILSPRPRSKTAPGSTATNLSPRDTAISGEPQYVDLSLKPNGTHRPPGYRPGAPPPEIRDTDLSTNPKVTVISLKPYPVGTGLSPQLQDTRLNLKCPPGTLSPEPNHVDPSPDPASGHMCASTLKPWTTNWTRITTGQADLCSPLQPRFTSKLILIMPKRARRASSSNSKQPGNVSETPGENPHECPADWRSVSRLHGSWP